MKPRGVWLALVALGLAAEGALAQPPATAVQLPTFSFFSTATTVSVPDRGSVYMGGIKRASSGRVERGVPLLPLRPFRNSAIGSERSASNVHVTATIHDFEAMEEMLLGQPTSPGSAQALRRQAAARGAMFLSRAAVIAHTLQPRNPAAAASWNVASPDVPADQPQTSLADANARRLRERHTRLGEAEDFFQRGQKAEQSGKGGVAKIYYQMAARRATGELKGHVLARLEALSSAAAASKIAQNLP